jgi:hypothetical protein
MLQQIKKMPKKVLKKNKMYMYMNELNDSQSFESLENLDEIIIKLNDQVGIMGNNLIEKQNELDYLKEVNEQLQKINKILMDQLNKKSSKILMNL